VTNMISIYTKDFFIEKMTQICQNWKEKNSILLDFYDDVAPKVVIISHKMI
jgi:hypothetical protein